VSTNPGTQVADPSHLDQITVTDASAGVESSSHVFSVLGPFDHFTFSLLSSVAKNQPFKLVVRAVDSAGNTLTGYTGSPTWSDTSNSLSSSTPAPFVGGVSVNSCTRIGATSTRDQINLDDSSAGVNSSSPAFDVNTAQVFNTPGTYTFTVPCPASATVTAIGAPGGSARVSCFRGVSSSGGEAAMVTGSLLLSAGEQLTAGVGDAGGTVTGCSGAAGSGGTASDADGGAGASGGNFAGNAAGGGGASLLSTGIAPPTASSLLLVAGGGGGAADGGAGGNAGSAGLAQTPQCPVSNIACGGGAGTATGTPPDSGTGGASDGDTFDKPGSDGRFLAGGKGGTGGNGGGGGGGGYYGGGGGGGCGSATSLAGGGGGGQNFIASSVTTLSVPTPTSNPAEVSITYAPPA
jgi:hypothetical protein